MVWNCQRDSGVTQGLGVRVTANRRTESRTMPPRIRSGCWLLIAEVSSEVSLPPFSPAGIARGASGEYLECSSQSGPFACSAGVGQSGRTAGGRVSVAQSAAPTTRPTVVCPRASRKCPLSR